MLKRGDIVKIRYSKELEAIGLKELVRRKAMITLVVNNKHGKCRGVYVIPRTGKYKNEEWFIPIQSIESNDTIDSFRAINLLKTTIL